ncbi:MAG: YfhO family protein [Oscillospiraceae bacterium]|nr:YfhO family protein [Oscillospiraceae bacterium]
MIIFVPFLIQDRGLFLYFGDYNVQQIPFYQLANQAVKDGNIWWNWNTDLGANFIGSYSFYLLGSPFFWLTLPFSSAIVPYLMAPLFVLKYTLAAVTSYAFLRRFVKTDNLAVIGALMYAFSSYMIYNTFYNHFLDVAVVFPLLLIALEELVVNNRRGYFAAAIALCSIMNYYFFFGQIVFVFIYFLLRSNCDEFRIDLKKMLMIAGEAAIGVLISGVILLPSVLALSGNPRLNNVFNGFEWLFYQSYSNAAENRFRDNPQRYAQIFQSLFFPADIPGRLNFFPESNSSWSSVSAFLPLFSMSGVIAFLTQVKRHWVRRLLIVSFIMALVPGLNSLFSGINSTYYARWFYMPVLIMCLATIIALENRAVDFTKGIKWTLLIVAVFSLIAVFPYREEGDIAWSWGGLLKYPDRFGINIAIGLVCVICSYIIIKYFREDGKKFFTASAASICAIAFVCGFTTISWGRLEGQYDYRQVVDMGIYGGDSLELPDDEFYRIDIENGMDNWGMMWNKPTINAFHSIVPPSIMRFYNEIAENSNENRTVASRPKLSKAGLRHLTSVKYLMHESDKKTEVFIPGFEVIAERNGFNIYENKSFIPMGFTYDYYISQEKLSERPDRHKDRIMLRSLVLSSEDIQGYGYLMKPISSSDLNSMTDNSMLEDCKDRRNSAAYSFETDNRGFTARIDMKESNLVFFSVPYDKGWEAYVNGVKADIIEANIGFMAVYAQQGNGVVIRFKYTTPGLYWGIALTLAGLLLLAAYIITLKILTKRYPAELAVNRSYHNRRKYHKNLPDAFGEMMEG